MQGQFVLETYFVMGMYGMIVMGVILLCEAGDEKVDPGVRKKYRGDQKSLQKNVFSKIYGTEWNYYETQALT